ncbi:MAG: SLBB domain-containing protein [Treponema sp.]|jgi:electron transport complex protein RnfC|nr:SLBB domain-containing protein [Treponema sp.]
MKKTYSFPQGGLVFEDPYAPPQGALTETAFLPVFSVIPLIQHTGNKAYPIVFIGEYVKEGMLIGRGQGQGSANIHATVPGKIVRMVSWKTVDGIANEALVIRMEGSFERLGKKEIVYQWIDLPPSELQRLIAEYGIVEMDEEGKPIADIFGDLATEKEAITVVIRCVFDNPWFAADRAICNERIMAVVEGSLITAKACGATSIIYAVSYKEKQIIDNIQKTVQILHDSESVNIPIAVVSVGNRYPQHNRRELELVLREYEKKENILLGRLFMVCPSTASAIHDAVKFHKPILDRYVAVGGSAVKTPKVLKVRIGMRLRDVFEQCGGLITDPARIVIGSPLLGRTVLDLDEPITKTSYAVLALLAKEIGGTVPRSCIDCGECRAVCPVGIDPEALYKQIICIPENPPLVDCHGCGCCEVVCPSRLPIGTTIYAVSKGAHI